MNCRLWGPQWAPQGLPSLNLPIGLDKTETETLGADMTELEARSPAWEGGEAPGRRASQALIITHSGAWGYASFILEMKI